MCHTYRLYFYSHQKALKQNKSPPRDYSFPTTKCSMCDAVITSYKTTLDTIFTMSCVLKPCVPFERCFDIFYCVFSLFYLVNIYSIVNIIDEVVIAFALGYYSCERAHGIPMSKLTMKTILSFSYLAEPTTTCYIHTLFRYDEERSWSIVLSTMLSMHISVISMCSRQLSLRTNFVGCTHD